jgi:hypothetical protein
MIVYRHIRLDKNEVFYVGIGKNEKRAFSKESRNDLWRKITNKHGYKVEIVARPETWENACELEKLLISEYGRLDLKTGCLANMTDGGDGAINLSEKTREKISLGNKGKTFKKSKPITEETRFRMREARKNVVISEKALKCLELGRKGRKQSEKTKLKIIESLKGRKQSEKTKLKRKETLKKIWQNEDLRQLKRDQTLKLHESGFYKNIERKPHTSKGKPFSGNKEKLSKSLKSYYLTSKPHNFIQLSDETKKLIFSDFVIGVKKFNLHKKYNLGRNVIDRVLNEFKNESE